ncbi:hypothetical protein [Parachitinimonas caeni]|uniref:Beta-ketoacyl synthase N-terminal domain-containing protein n=1 Tax=Parachitinimonas caeni TaxID=3031301 RepID=A0ABT7E396_9NEIS|nr:hypothetical protein [Parachitinimonas caeni]MDK2126781.1 hypothetical protein [Parachitinimonas caeni]
MRAVLGCPPVSLASGASPEGFWRALVADQVLAALAYKSRSRQDG